ncbi:MAG: aspartate-semialdehyde dehydrogenase [Deltaproteobacteria bacterium]|nr:aspartate-semialdehyde dehydrogenase [Deltaproteobacteria bacterium]
MSTPSWNIAIIGATGLVGKEMVSILEERNFPVGKLYLFASEKSEGNLMPFQQKSHRVQKLTPENIERCKNIDLALFSAGNEISKKFIPLFAERGTISIDNSSAFRMDPEVPLVVPEVNYEAISQFKNKNMISNPNCSTVQLVQVLKPIHDAYRIKRVVVSTYQSTSGKGKEGMEELSQQTVALFTNKDLKVSEFPHQIAFNCIPHIDSFFNNGYTFEEMKVILETQKILNAPQLKVSATCVRIPTFSCHGESVNIETYDPFTVEEVVTLLSQTKGIKVVDDPQKNIYPTNVLGTGKNETFVGRLRPDVTVEHGLNLWIISDNLRKGAALNAVQISEALIHEFL